MLVNFLFGGGGGGSGQSTEKRGKKTFGILHEICVLSIAMMKKLIYLTDLSVFMSQVVQLHKRLKKRLRSNKLPPTP